MTTPRLIDVTLCDEIRREDNGKFLFIGVYTGHVLVPRLPFDLPTLTFFTKWSAKAGDSLDGCFEVYSPDRKLMYRLDSPFEGGATLDGVVHVALAVRGFRFTQEGTYRLDHKPSVGRRRNLLAFDVRLGKPLD